MDFTQQDLEAIVTFKTLLQYQELAKHAFANKLDSCSFSDVKHALDAKIDRNEAFTKTEFNKTIRDYIGRVFRYQGSTKFSDLPVPTEEMEGFTYNVTDGFVTTNDFIEGAGRNCPPGTSISVVVITPSIPENKAKGEPFIPAVCKWDVIAGTIDLSPYALVKDTFTQSQVKNEIDKKADYFYTKEEVDRLLLNRLLNTYKAKGSAKFSELGDPKASMLGWVYNMAEAFKTDDRFLEGPGSTYMSGTNIVVTDAGDGVYKYDVLAGIVTDLGDYYTKEQVDTKLESADMRSLRRNKAYKAGDVAYSQYLPSWAMLECVQSGITDSTDPFAPIYLTSSKYTMAAIFPEKYATANLFDYIFESVNLTSTYAMFKGCNSMVESPFIDTCVVTDAHMMFANCGALTKVNSNYDFSKVTNANDMFYGCTLLAEIPDFDFEKVYQAGNMLAYCGNIVTLPDLKLPAVKQLSCAFFQCTKLATMPAGISYDQVENMNSICFGCTELTDISAFKTDKATDLGSAFNGCTKLVTVPKLNISSISDASKLKDMFANTAVLTVTFVDAQQAVKDALTTDILGKSIGIVYEDSTKPADSSVTPAATDSTTPANEK